MRAIALGSNLWFPAKLSVVSIPQADDPSAKVLSGCGEAWVTWSRPPSFGGRKGIAAVAEAFARYSDDEVYATVEAYRARSLPRTTQPTC